MKASLSSGTGQLSGLQAALSRVKVVLRMNKLSGQTTSLTQQTHMHRFKGERAESNFLQHSARNQVIKHTSRRLQAPFMCSLQGNKHVMQSTSFNM